MHLCQVKDHGWGVPKLAYYLQIRIKTTEKHKTLLPSLLDISMSDSPIIQDGKLIGAVTHVLVNDPTMGYGIVIENMLDTVA